MPSSLYVMPLQCRDPSIVYRFLSIVPMFHLCGAIPCSEFTLLRTSTEEY